MTYMVSKVSTIYNRYLGSVIKNLFNRLSLVCLKDKFTSSDLEVSVRNHKELDQIANAKLLEDLQIAAKWIRMKKGIDIMKVHTF